MAGQDRATREHEFEDELPEDEYAQEHLQWRDLRKVKLAISADLGNCQLTVREILALQRGSVLPLNKLAGEMADIYLGSTPLGKGEVVVLGDTLHVRIAEVTGATEMEMMEYE